MNFPLPEIRTMEVLSKAIVFNPGTDPDGANNDANLIGNPYPSAIDPNIFIPANTGVFDGAIYVWRHQQDVVGGILSAG